MAKVLGKNATLADKGSKSRPGDQNGHIKNHYDEYTFVGELALNDVISLGKIPKGAKVKSITILTPVAITTAAIKIGYAATDKDATDRTADLMAAGSIAAAGAVHLNMMNDPLTEEKEIIATVTTGTAGATGKVVKFGVNFVAD